MNKAMHFVSAALFFVAMCTAHAAPSLSDGEALQLLTNPPSRLISGYAVFTGTFKVTDNGDAVKRLLSKTTLKEYQKLQKSGLVTIEFDSKYENYKKGDDFSWGQFLDQTQNRTAAIVTVNVTDKAKQYKIGEYEGSQFMAPHTTLRLATMSDVSIKKNEARQIGADDYRLLVITSTFDFEPELAAGNRWGFSGKHKMKSMRLLKYDPAKGEWKHVAADTAPLDAEYTTSAVNDFLMKR